jgi:conjugative transposon TraN protein
MRKGALLSKFSFSQKPKYHTCMRQLNIILVAIFFFAIAGTSFSQSQSPKSAVTIIQPYDLKITTNKTTNLIFPTAIKSVDRGSGQVLAQKAKGVDNILLVKAAREKFAETNLTVITADGRLHSFILNYTDNPTAINISIQADTTYSNDLGLPVLRCIDAAFPVDIKSVLLANKKIRGIKNTKYDMRLELHGVLVKNNLLFFKVQVVNDSNISYDVNMLSFYIRDRKRSLRTANQEIEMQVKCVYGDTSTIKPRSSNVIVFAFEKFTIPEKKYLSFELIEANGGRNLKLNISNKIIIKAEALK